MAGKPASFKVESLSISPPEINIGEWASISVNVTNTGESEGKYLLTLKINTKEIDAREISLAGETSQRVTFKSTSNTPGKKIVEINGLIGGFIVKGEVQPPQQIPLPLEKTETNVKPETGSIPQVPSPAASQELVKTTGSKAWVFGVIAGGVLLVASVTVYLTRRRKRG